MNEKYVYFRIVTDVADDDDKASSVMFPLSSFRGVNTISSGNLVFYFKTIHEMVIRAGGDRDFVWVTCTGGEEKTTIQAILKEFATGDDIFITVADKVTNEFMGSINNVLAITVNIESV